MNTIQTVKSLTLNKVIISKIVWILSFSILTAIAAQIAIPVKPVPFTLQTMIVLLSGAFLGAKNGAYSQLIYLSMGVVGLPVFAQVADAGIGLARLFGPTGGYLLAFPVAAFIVGHLIELEKSRVLVVSAMFLGEIIILLFGVIHLYVLYLNDFGDAMQAGAAIFSLWTIVKVFAASSIYFKITNQSKRKRKSQEKKP